MSDYIPTSITFPRALTWEQASAINAIDFSTEHDATIEIVAGLEYPQLVQGRMNYGGWAVRKALRRADIPYAAWWCGSHGQIACKVVFVPGTSLELQVGADERGKVIAGVTFRFGVPAITSGTMEALSAYATGCRSIGLDPD